MSRSFLYPVLLTVSAAAFGSGDCCPYPGQHLAHEDRLLDQASADLNGDGAPDLAVAIVDGPIRVYLSDDSGAEPVTLASFTEYSIELSEASATSLRFTDVDGDQTLDLVASTSAGFDGKGAIEYFSGNGDGSFQTPSQRQVFDADKPVDDVKLIDVDGDGNQDAVAHVLNEVNPLNADYTKYRAGDGNGGFAGTLTDLPMRWTLQSGIQILPTRLYTPDLNQDGEPDLLSLNEQFLVWRLNTPTGLLNPTSRGSMRLVSSNTSPPHLESAAFGQLDSDANLEIAMTSLQEEQVYLLEFSGGNLVEESYGPLVDEPVTEPRSVAITDLDGDGLDDLVVSGRDAPYLTAWYRRTGDGTFAAPQTTRTMAGRNLLPFGEDTLSVGDINLEYVRLLHLDDDDRLSPLDIEQKDGNDNPFDLDAHVLGDMNNDGDPDITVLTRRKLRVLLGDGSGEFSLHSGGMVDPGLGEAMAGGDFDGDGHLDIAVAGNDLGSCNVLISLGDSTGALSPQSPAVCNDNFPAENVTGLASADLDGQNGPDLVVLNDSSYEVLLNPGDGDFSQASYERAALSDSPENLLVADIDGQNGPDLVGTETFDEEIRVYLNNGDGSFAAATVTSIAQWTRGLDSGDFNGDGNTDLALMDYEGGSEGVRVLAGNGDGTFATTPLMTHRLAPESKGLWVLDYNDDGRLDLVAATGSDPGTRDGTDLLVLLENQGNNSLAVAGRFGYAIRTSGAIEGVAIADLDGDNDTDLLAHGTSGVRTFLQEGSGPANPNQAPTGQDESLSRVAGFSVDDDLVSLTSITDPDGDTLSFSASNVPSGLSVDGDGRLTGTPDATALANSPHDLVLTADDGEAQLDVTITLTVTNQAPVASGVQPVNISVGDSLNVDVGAGFSDPDGHDLSFSQQGLPPALSLSSQGILTGTVDQAMVDNAPFTVMVTADDGFETTDAGVSVLAGNPDDGGGVTVDDDDDDGTFGGGPWLLPLLGLLGALRRRL
jgi:MYXO-CTERM domain-containing protein